MIRYMLIFLLGAFIGLILGMFLGALKERERGSEQMKCKICGERMRLKSENRYEVIEKPVGFDCLVKGITTYEAFDCPNCGCQNIVGIRKPKFEEKKCENTKEDSDDI